MPKSHTARKSLAPLIAGLFVVSIATPSASAIYSEDSSTIEAPDTNAVFELNQPTVITDPVILLATGEAATNAITRPLGAAVAECRGVGSAYAASCAAAAFKKAARAASKPDYRDARKELRNAAKELEKLVSQNVDREAPKKKGTNGSYKAVKQSAVASVNKQAIKIIQETETKLLRSAGSGERKVHYQRIAQAVGSTKVIFRS